LSSADKSNARHPKSMGVDGPLGSLENPRVAAQAEVIVRAKIKNLRSVNKRNFGILLASDDAFTFEQSGRLNLLQFFL